MWHKIKQVATTISSMLQSGSVPPNTPARYVEDLSKVNFLASKKFYVVFCSVIILGLFYVASIFVLFLTAMAPHLTLPFVSIFSETIKILAIIIASYLGVQTVLDYRIQSNSNVDISLNRDETVGEDADQKVVEQFERLYENEPSYAPLDWTNKFTKL